jgi:hypothetical protein
MLESDSFSPLNPFEYDSHNDGLATSLLRQQQRDYMALREEKFGRRRENVANKFKL